MSGMTLGFKQKKPLYVLPHGIEVIGIYPAIGKNPYVRLRIRPHPFFAGTKITSNGMSVRQNRVLLAIKLGRALARNERAHHKDENRTNDDSDNLHLMSAAEHNRHHKTGSQHRPESKAKTSASLKSAYREGRHAPFVPREQRGELNPAAKLNWDKVAEIRASTETNAVLAAQYQVSRRNISFIRSRKTWNPAPPSFL